MIIDDVRIDRLGFGNARLSWTGDPDAVTHVYVNGRSALARQVAGAEKSVVVALPDPAIVEVHELPPGLDPAVVSITLERRPLIRWSSQDGAEQYRIHHQPDGGTERVIAHVAHSPDALHREVRAPVDLRRDGKRWCFLRVEAIDVAGELSARPPWPLFVAALPAPPAGLDVTGGGGTFDLELEVSS